MAEVFNVFN